MRLYATDAQGNKTNEIIKKITIKSNPPSPVTNLTLTTEKNSTTIIASWDYTHDKDLGFTKYVIIYFDQVTSDIKIKKEITNVNTKRIEIENLNFGSTYTVEVVVVDGFGIYSHSASSDITINKISPIVSLQNWLSMSVDQRPDIETTTFANQSLNKQETKKASDFIFQDHQKQLATQYTNQWDNRELSYDGLTMPFYVQTFGSKPSDGYKLYISMNVGGQANPEINDQQYKNQKHLYDNFMRKVEGVYIASRAPTNIWNLWHQPHIDVFFNRMIQLAVEKMGVNPNKVYLIGYSAVGDGVYQLGPRMADRFAAASMMAGHPNESSPLGLRNLPFAIHVGALDSVYDRNKKAEEWG